MLSYLAWAPGSTGARGEGPHRVRWAGRSRSTGVVGLQHNPEVGLCRGCIRWLAARSGHVVFQPIIQLADPAAGTAFHESAGFDIDLHDAGYALVGRLATSPLGERGSPMLEVLGSAGADSELDEADHEDLRQASHSTR